MFLTCDVYKLEQEWKSAIQSGILKNLLNVGVLCDLICQCSDGATDGSCSS